MTTISILILVWWHWFADFFLQSHEMAINKSKSNYWLGYHVLVYTLVFMFLFGPTFAIVNGILHFITDYITSRKTSQLWADEKVHQFFVWIGFDQAIHMTCLVLTYTAFNTTLFGYLS